MTQRRSNKRRRVITSAPGAECPPRIRRPHRRRGGAGGGAAATFGTADPERPWPPEATAQRTVPATLRASFLLAGMRHARRAAILTVMSLRCPIVGDNAGFLRSARLLLEREGIDVVAVAPPREEARRPTHDLRPDRVLVGRDPRAAGGV